MPVLNTDLLNKYYKKKRKPLMNGLLWQLLLWQYEFTEQLLLWLIVAILVAII